MLQQPHTEDIAHSTQHTAHSPTMNISLLRLSSYNFVKLMIQKIATSD